MRPEQQTPLVSTVITTLNRPQLLLRAIESVFAQTYENLELIVVVDGPDADTMQQLSGIGQAQLRVMQLEKNVGISEARNTGVALARGEWVAFLDDDDEWLPQKIEKQVAAVLAAPSSVNFCACRYQELNGTDTRLRPKYFPGPNEHWGLAFYRRAGLLLPSTFLVKRSLMLSVPYTKGLRRTEDADWCLRAQLGGLLQPCWVEEALTIYHCELTRARLSSEAAWKAQYEWSANNPTLMPKEVLPYYIGMICIPEAKRSPSPFRSCAFLLKEAVTKGRLTFHSAAYLAVATLSSISWRSRIRRRLPMLQRRTSA